MKNYILYLTDNIDNRMFTIKMNVSQHTCICYLYPILNKEFSNDNLTYQ